jgi:ectoine hydroxylase-related dioxygenase (phytanoyl-CoA dioxygenase family)
MAFEDQIAQIREKGFTILRNAIEYELMDALAEAVERLEDEVGEPAAASPADTGHTLRIHNLLRRGKPFDEVPVHPEVLPLVEAILDRGCLVSSMTAVIIERGERAEPIHAIDQAIPLEKPHRPLMCSCVWALSDFTVGNGATRIVPGSHLLPNPEYGVKYEAITAEMPRGSVLIFDGALWNGAGAHASGAPRQSISMNYCAGFLRPEENQLLGISPDLVRTFPPRLQEMLGWGVYRGHLGHVERQSPAHSLNAGRKFKPLWEK